MENNKTGLWKWLVGLLVVCNLSLIAIIWFRPQPGGPAGMQSLPPGPEGRGGRPVDFDRELNFTNEQRARFDRMLTEQRIKVDSIKRLARAVRDSFFDNLKVAAPDQAATNRLGSELGEYHRMIETQTFSHFREVRAMLTDEQKETFDKIIKVALARMPEQPHDRSEKRENGPAGEQPGDRRGPPPPPGDGGGPGMPPGDGPPQGR